jgi:hypothetical protein
MEHQRLFAQVADCNRRNPGAARLTAHQVVAPEHGQFIPRHHWRFESFLSGHRLSKRAPALAYLLEAIVVMIRHSANDFSSKINFSFASWW